MMQPYDLRSLNILFILLYCLGMFRLAEMGNSYWSCIIRMAPPGRKGHFRILLMVICEKRRSELVHQLLITVLSTIATTTSTSAIAIVQLRSKLESRDHYG